MDEEQHNPILDAVEEKITVVPYTKKDRRLNYFIATIVVLNLGVVVSQVPWSWVW